MKLKNVNFAVINGSSTAETRLAYLFDPGRNDFGSRSQNFHNIWPYVQKPVCYQFVFNPPSKKAKLTDYISDSTSTKVQPKVLKPHFIDIII